MEIVCPVDKKDDSIQKLSAIVAGGTATGSFSGPSGRVVNVDGKWGYGGGYTTLSGGTMTDLAKKLSPPDKPKIKGLGCWWVPIIYPGSVLVTVGLTAVIYTTFGSINTLTKVITGLFGIFILIIYIKIFKGIEQGINEESKKEVQKWEGAFKKWNELYYCHRHDLVFNPINNETITIDNIPAYCGF